MLLKILLQHIQICLQNWKKTNILNYYYFQNILFCSCQNIQQMIINVLPLEIYFKFTLKYFKTKIIKFSYYFYIQITSLLYYLKTNYFIYEFKKNHKILIL